MLKKLVFASVLFLSPNIANEPPYLPLPFEGWRYVIKDGYWYHYSHTKEWYYYNKDSQEWIKLNEQTPGANRNTR